MPKGHEVMLLRSPWIENLGELLSVVHDELLIACPFVTRFATEYIAHKLDKRGFSAPYISGLLPISDQRVFYQVLWISTR